MRLNFSVLACRHWGCLSLSVCACESVFVCVCVGVCVCVCGRRRRRRRRDFYCVSENSFSVCDHCGVTHATSGLEVFLMDPRFQCETPTIQEVKALLTSRWWSTVRYYDQRAFKFWPPQEISLPKGLECWHEYVKERKYLLMCLKMLVLQVGKHLLGLAGCKPFFI